MVFWCEDGVAERGVSVWGSDSRLRKDMTSRYNKCGGIHLVKNQVSHGAAGSLKSFCARANSDSLDIPTMCCSQTGGVHLQTRGYVTV